MNKLLWTKQLTPRQGTKTLLCQASAFASPLETTYAPSGDENFTRCSEAAFSSFAKQLTPRQGTKTRIECAACSLIDETTYRQGTKTAPRLLLIQSMRNNLHPARGRKLNLDIFKVRIRN